MLSVFGVAPSDIVSAGSVLAQFPPLSGRAVGGAIPVDCQVSVLKLAAPALNSTNYWPWKPADRGYVVAARNFQSSVVKNHLRQIRHIQDVNGSNHVWPWFDPRYLKLVLNGLEGPALAKIFGPLELFGFADDLGVKIFQLRSGLIHVSMVQP